MNAEALTLLARALDYPGADLKERCEALASLLADPPEARRTLDRFREAIAPLAPERLEEIYAGTFDVNPASCLYVGYHLFGDSYKRGAFMARLNGEYRERGFDRGNELPDHLPVLLRFPGSLDECELRSWLLYEAIVPGLEKIAAAFEDSDNVYGDLVRTARIAVRPSDYVPPHSGVRTLPILRRQTDTSSREWHHGTRI